MQPDELYAALCVATPSCAPRVEALLEEWRAQTRQAGQRNAMYQAGLHPLAPPTHTVIAMLDEQEAAARAAWDAVKARMAARQYGT